MGIEPTAIGMQNQLARALVHVPPFLNNQYVKEPTSARSVGIEPTFKLLEGLVLPLDQERIFLWRQPVSNLYI